ncbi:MAG TPA: hypothetical protein VLL77_06335 [Anaerolineales bacterium]|nr:hypothetical protein [Anaerolineales bacterium]
MSPIYLTLFAIVVTLVLTLVVSRRQSFDPSTRRGLWFLVAAGLVALVFLLLFFR